MAKKLSDPVVSIISPVYNGEDYFVECIQSVLNQTYGEWEYIIVDNCSADTTGDIAAHFARQDARIRVHRNNEFVSALRNHNIGFGLMSPHSKYCKVLHADDWMFPDCLRQMVDLAEENASVGVVSAYSLYGTDVECTGLPYTSTVVPGRDICRRYLRRELNVFLSPSSVLIRSDIVRSKLPKVWREDRIHADVELWLEALLASDFGFVHQVLTFVRPHADSMTAKVGELLNTWTPSELDMLQKFGLECFDADEYERIWSRTMDEYLRFLGRCLFRRRGKAFWDFHRGQMKQLGHPLRPLRLALVALREALSVVAFPLVKLRRVLTPADEFTPQKGQDYLIPGR